jgi:hypothetical protein
MSAGGILRPVLHRLLKVCLIVMLLLQGVAQASDIDCSCCEEQQMTMSIGCTALCSVMADAPGNSFGLAPQPPSAADTLIVHWHAGPSYLPLIPPPIS